jgi:hypothetical protein
MNHFQKAVHEAVSSGLRTKTHPVRGLIPQGGINKDSRLCTVQIHNPKAGKQPGVPDNLEFRDLPLPYAPDGLIQAILNPVKDAPRVCTVGFRGGNLSFPYIISLGSYLTEVKDKQDEKVPNRKPATAQKLTTAGSPGTGRPPARGFIGPPNPAAGPAQPPTTAGSTKTAAKAAESSQQTGVAMRSLMNRSVDVKMIVQ